MKKIQTIIALDKFNITVIDDSNLKYFDTKEIDFLLEEKMIELSSLEKELTHLYALRSQITKLEIESVTGKVPTLSNVWRKERKNDFFEEIVSKKIEIKNIQEKINTMYSLININGSRVLERVLIMNIIASGLV